MWFFQKFAKRTLLLLASWLALAWLFPFAKTTAQAPPIRLRLLPLDADSAFLQKRLKPHPLMADSAQAFAELKNVVAQLQAQAHLEASVDSTAWQDSISLTAWLHLGPEYEWASLRNGNVPEDLLNRSGFRPRLFEGKPLRFGEIQKLQERLLQEAENTGFPFAKIRLDSLRFAGGGQGTFSAPSSGAKQQVSAGIFLTPGPLVLYDSLVLEGDARISMNYLRQYLGIRASEPYSRRQVLRIRQRVRELPFLQEKKNALVTFRDGKADLRLFLEKKKASRFDFLIGVLPDANRTTAGQPDQRVLITGTFNAEFQNQFGLGERIYAAFERLRPQTQRLEVAFTYPYILTLPFGVDLKFNQYRRDSTYTDVIGEFGVQYLFEGGNYLKAFWNTTASNLLSVDTAAIQQGRFPSQLDVRNRAFGLEANWLALDYRLNPRRGWSAFAKASAGTRQIERNQAILNVAENFYDTLPGRTFRFVMEGRLEHFFALLERSTLKLAARSGAIVSEAAVYRNEQFRIGGNRLLRGFDEESIFATMYHVLTLEYRLLVGQNSYFFVFGDYGFVQDRRIGQPTFNDRPFGLGGGLTYETSAGLISIGMAVGKRSGDPLDFRNPKVHVGFVSLF